MDITVETLLRHGTLIVFAWVFAVQVGVPIPTAPLLMAVGALGSLGKLSLGWALVGALGGSLVADLLWYGIGRRWGHWIRRTTAADRARDLFLAHRLGALVIGKFFFEVNAAVAALAGARGSAWASSSRTTPRARCSGPAPGRASATSSRTV